MFVLFQQESRWRMFGDTFGGIQWGLLLQLAVPLVLALIVFVAIFMTIHGAYRIRHRNKGGRPLFLVGGPVFGFITGAMMLELLEQPIALATVLVAGVVLTVLLWVLSLAFVKFD